MKQKIKQETELLLSNFIFRLFSDWGGYEMPDGTFCIYEGRVHNLKQMMDKGFPIAEPFAETIMEIINKNSGGCDVGQSD